MVEKAIKEKGNNIWEAIMLDILSMWILGQYYRWWGANVFTGWWGEMTRRSIYDPKSRGKVV